jgi:ADP-dependent NAD(P)H-hydrate dehydratase / NAD(P)H-hydrate epimerase
MKILSTTQIREADAYTIQNEPIAPVDLMERAAKAIAAWFIGKFPKKTKLKIFAGPGSNGGDGLALARLLAGRGMRAEVFIISPESGYSRDASINIGRLKSMNILPSKIKSGEDFPSVDPDDVIVDALFGTGLNRALTGLSASLIDYLNETGVPIIAVDIPSGLFGDDNRSNGGKSIIRAKHTLSFQFPKLAFMFPENEQYTGEWEILPIGLHRDYIESVKTSFHFVDRESIKPFLKIRKRFSHKGNFGHCLLISGSHGRMGAAVLAAGSCIRSGAGLVTTHVPAKGCDILQAAVPEVMVSIDDSDTYFSGAPSLDPFDAVAVGPAIGTRPQSQKALYDLLQSVTRPIILDADALNILSLNKEWLRMIPRDSILTPHPGEFDRLAGQQINSHDRLLSQIEMAAEYKLYIVLKGGNTSVATPQGTCYFNGSGNPGMATAGSGDVLTGIILSFLGQGYRPLEAALAGVFIHGMAGDLASVKNSQEAMIASDIIRNLGKAFNLLKI